MANTVEDVRRLEKEFKACRKILTALGDDTRQHLLCIMLRCECGGSRVIDIAEQTNLSRPAVSHHLRQLKAGGLIVSRRDGKEVYYKAAPTEQAETFHHMIEWLVKIACPTPANHN